MADPDLIAVVKALQTQMENQSISLHQTLQQYMATVDTWLEDLCSQVQNIPGFSSNSTNPPMHTTVGIAETSPVLRSLRMEVPKFDGSDPNGWIFRIEEFFDFHGTPEQVRLRIVSFHIEGRVAVWFQWMKANRLLKNWRDFLTNIKHQLDVLSGLMAKEGYAADVKFVLHDVEEDEKLDMLCGHSERLAIAFGLLHTKPGTPLLVMRNLRVCGECHAVTKYISKIMNREILVRDANRFHLFKYGTCSCGDHW